MIIADIVAQRVECEWCHAAPGEACTDYDGDSLTTCHAQRWGEYKTQVQYTESVWELADDSYLTYGMKKGDRFAGVPHWYEKKMITITRLLTQKDTKAPSCVVNSNALYWVDWFDIDREDY